MISEPFTSRQVLKTVSWQGTRSVLGSWQEVAASIPRRAWPLLEESDMGASCIGLGGMSFLVSAGRGGFGIVLARLGTVR